MNRSRSPSVGASLQHFVVAQDNPREGHGGGASFSTALCELTAGRKTSHWIWYVLPQMLPLPVTSPPSERAAFYAIRTPEMAIQYLSHEVLGARYLQCIRVILAHLERWNAELLKCAHDERVNPAQFAPPRCVVSLMGSTVDTVKLYLSLSTFVLASCTAQAQPVERRDRESDEAVSALCSLSSSILLLTALVEVVRNSLLCGVTPLLGVVPVEMRSLEVMRRCKDWLSTQTDQKRSEDHSGSQANPTADDSCQCSELDLPAGGSVAENDERKESRRNPDPVRGGSTHVRLARRLCHPGVRTAWELRNVESDKVVTR